MSALLSGQESLVQNLADGTEATVLKERQYLESLARKELLKSYSGAMEAVCDLHISDDGKTRWYKFDCERFDRTITLTRNSSNHWLVVGKKKKHAIAA